MKVILTKNSEELAKVAVQNLLGVMYSKQDRVNLSITAGTSPVETYQLLVDEVKDKPYFDNVYYYNFDEIPYKNAKRDGTTLESLKEMFLTAANIKEKNIRVLNENNWENYDKQMSLEGGLDCIFLGVGTDGHYCGNIPGFTTIDDHVTRCSATKEYIKVLEEEDFMPKDEIPDYWITMGPRTVMNARKIIMIATGTHKAEIVNELLGGKFSEKIPASLLLLHPDFTLIIDEAAASKLSESYLETLR